MTTALLSIPLRDHSFSELSVSFFGLTAALMLFYPELPEFLFGTDDTTINSLASGNIQGLINTNGALGFRIRMLLHQHGNLCIRM
ncbi:hypothetical protein [Chryseobacterium indoltheticum]|uniref:hypothetical protein n=1 Tax=Chryseobacterium indoltheticum TaxID=254 RepID=UPI003F491366